MSATLPQQKDLFLQAISKTKPTTLRDKIKGRRQDFELSTDLIKGLLASGTTEINKIVDITGLHKETVRQRIKYIENSDLANPKFINPAAQALKFHLKENNLDAVKMVYNHINAAQGMASNRSGSSTININFEGLSNSESERTITEKATKHTINMKAE